MTVVRLGAWCDYVIADESFNDGASFRVQEFAVLDDGRRILLEEGLGFTTGARVAGRRGFVDPWPTMTLEQLEADVRTTVLPDDDDTADEHPWGWLVECLSVRGVRVSAEELEQVPYEVEFSPRLRTRVLARAADGSLPKE